VERTLRETTMLAVVPTAQPRIALPEAQVPAFITPPGTNEGRSPSPAEPSM
jgi:hypothetical protein